MNNELLLSQMAAAQLRAQRLYTELDQIIIALESRAITSSEAQKWMKEIGVAERMVPGGGLNENGSDTQIPVNHHLT